jgi:hypothetical protein
MDALTMLSPRSEPPPPTLAEWLDERYNSADLNVKTRIEDRNRIRQRKGKGYTKHLAAVERSIAAAQGYRNALHELHEALLAGDVELPTEAESELEQLQTLAREVVEIWRAGPYMHDREEFEDAVAKLAAALPPKPATITHRADDPF